MHPLLRLLSVLLCLLSSVCAAQPGALVILGGGARPDAVLDTLVARAGGAAARYVVVPYASGEPEEAGAALRDDLLTHGAAQVVVVLGAPDADTTLAALDGATGVFFAGGDQVRLLDALRGTRFLDRVRALHAAGAVVSGTSAGAAAMSARMITGRSLDPEADPDRPFPAIRPDRVETVEGFGFVSWAVVDQHFVARARHNRLLSLALAGPEWLGVGIDEATALVVEPGGRFHIVGDGAVVVYDAAGAKVATDARGLFRASGVALHVLTAGDAFDPATRRVE